MAKYILKRLVYFVPTVFGVMLITFLLFNVIGGDVTDEYAGQFADPQTKEEIRSELGLDKPLFLARDSQFFTHLKNAVTFNFGRARDHEKISDKLIKRAPYSLALTIPMLFGTVIISIILALIAAYYHNSLTDYLIICFSTIGVSLPFLSFILFGQYFLAYRWGLFPVYFWPDLSMPQYIALPLLIGILAGLGGNVRFYRTVMLDEVKSDYVRAASAKGLSPAAIIFKHVLRNAMIPVITKVVMSIPFLFLGSLLLERFFGIPGLGSLIIDAVGARDYQLLNAVVYIAAVLVAVFTLLADISYVLIDPRITLAKQD